MIFGVNWFKTFYLDREKLAFHENALVKFITLNHTIWYSTDTFYYHSMYFSPSDDGPLRMRGAIFVIAMHADAKALNDTRFSAYKIKVIP